MKKYEYKFVEVKKQMGLAGITFEECKKVIISEAECGWRLKQIVRQSTRNQGLILLFVIKLFLKEKYKLEVVGENKI